MKTRTLVLAAVCMLASPLCALFAEPPATQPAAIPVPKDETPRQAFQRIAKTFDSLNVEAAIALHLLETDTERKLVRGSVLLEVATLKAETAMEKRFGRKAADDFIHAVGEHTEAEAEAADILVERDRASLKFAGEEPGYIHRINGVWMFRASDWVDKMSDHEVTSMMNFYRDMTPFLTRFAADVEAGRVATAESAIKLVKDAFSPRPPEATDAKK